MSEDPATSHLFILRLWSEQLPDGRLEWRGRLQHPQTNQTRHFRDWPALVPLLLALIRQGEGLADADGTIGGNRGANPGIQSGSEQA